MLTVDKISNKHKIIAGIDIGGTNTVLGFLDLNDEIIFSTSFATKPQEGVNLFISKLVGLINDECLKLGSLFELSGIGIAAPSANYFKGTIESPANLNWGNINFIEIMKKYYDLPVGIINDANAAALGEHNFGAARGLKNFIVLTLGTGLGSGIFVNGNLIHGENGLAGELGHTIIDMNGRQCNCGRTGCLETYVSANGIKRSVFYFLSHSNEESELRNISFSDLTSKKISELARNGDAIALKVFDYTGEILGKAMANMVTFYDPEAIILFGGLADADDLLLKPANYYFDKYLLNMYKGKVTLLKSELQNGKAGILGACSLIKESEIVKMAFS